MCVCVRVQWEGQCALRVCVCLPWAGAPALSVPAPVLPGERGCLRAVRREVPLRACLCSEGRVVLCLCVRRGREGAFIGN